MGQLHRRHDDHHRQLLLHRLRAGQARPAEEGSKRGCLSLSPTFIPAQRLLEEGLRRNQTNRGNVTRKENKHGLSVRQTQSVPHLSGRSTPRSGTAWPTCAGRTASWRCASTPRTAPCASARPFTPATWGCATDISHDPDNEIVILTGTGDSFVALSDPEMSTVFPSTPPLSPMTGGTSPPPGCPWPGWTFPCRESAP